MNEQDNDIRFWRLLSIGIATFLILVMATYFIGEFWFASEQISATITDIRYYDDNKAQLTFDDGTALSLDTDSFPSSLKIGQFYELQYIKPYILRKPYLVKD